jgi:NADH:ubiquinone oxidoreductase subunit B-like Fe-S oxidoreductase
MAPLSKYVHVDVAVAGCTPKPEAIMDGLVQATEILKEKRKAWLEAKKNGLKDGPKAETEQEVPAAEDVPASGEEVQQ